MHRLMKVVSVAAVVGLTATACGSKPTTTASSSSTSGGSASASTSSLTACMVLDTGGVDDRSFNQSSYAGLTAAAKANPNIKVSYVASNSTNDYTPNLNAAVTKKCGTIIGVGGLMGPNVKAVAAKNPTMHFAEVDNAPSEPNVYGLQFNTAQSGFLGGYLAAAMTKTGKVATWGGLNIPPVTIYMDGFWEGVQYFNKTKTKSVQVLGWDENKPKAGTFSQAFDNQGKGKSITSAFIGAGADVIFPVAGGSGLGAGAAAAASGGKASLIWVDTDGCVSASQYCKYFISSVTKSLAESVQLYTSKAAAGTFPTGSYIGDLKNNGTGLAPFHDFDSKVPAATKTELDSIKADIISGKITITSPSQPK